MKLYKILMFIAAMVLTLVVWACGPKLHKPFVLVKQDFKMTQYSQEPASLQTLKLLRMGESQVENKKIIAQVPEESGIIKTPVHIEPSEFYQMASCQKKQQQQMSQTPPPKYSIEDFITPPQQNLPQNVENPEEQPEEEFEVSEPIDNSIKGRILQKREETIAWNKWRSDLQNKIMEDATVPAPLGTIFFFSFNVDDKQRVSNISVLCSNPFYQKEAVETILPVIESYSGKSFLKFPKKTKRRSVRFDGSYMIWIENTFATPDNYNDFERIQYYE